MKISKLSKMFGGSRRGVFAVALVVAVIVGGGGVAYASDNGNSVTKGESNSTIYKAGNNVSVTGTVNGDVYCAGQTIMIDADVNGDVICAGQTITVHGNVNGNLRLAGQTITINGKVTRNATIAGQDINLSTNSVIGQDALIFGQTVNLNGNVGRDVNVSALNINVNGPVGRNFVANVGEKLNLQSSAKVGGSLTYTGPNTLVKSSGAVVAGTTTYHKTEKKQNNVNFAWLYVAWRVYLIAAFTLFSIVLVTLFPQLFRRWNQVARKQVGITALTGLITIVLVPLVIFAAFLSLLGAPLGILLLLAWLALAMLSFPFAYYYVGSMVMPKMHPVLMILTVAIAFGLLEAIPFLGMLIMILAHLFGIGIIAMNAKRLYQKPDYSVE